MMKNVTTEDLQLKAEELEQKHIDEQFKERQEWRAFVNRARDIYIDYADEMEEPLSREGFILFLQEKIDVNNYGPN